MKTQKGTSYKNLLDIRVVDTHTLMVTLPEPHNIVQWSYEDNNKAIAYITDIVQCGKRGAGTFEKCLLQIEMHRSLLAQAYAKLVESYTYATTPQSRATSTDKADKIRRDMLMTMPDKVLRMYANVYIAEDIMNDIILPDDRERLIDLVAQVGTALEANKE